MNNRNAGINAELFVAERLRQLKVDYEYIDDWYDFNILKERVEVKSCALTVKSNRTSYGKRMIGIYNMGTEDAREQHYNEDVWYLFLVRYKKQFLILGFIKARMFDKKYKVSIHKVIGMKPKDFQEWYFERVKV